MPRSAQLRTVVAAGAPVAPISGSDAGCSVDDGRVKKIARKGSPLASGVAISGTTTDCGTHRMFSQGSSGSDLLFRVIVTQSDSEVVVALSGELDLAGAPRLRECFAQLEHVGATQVVLDLTDLDFVDSTGLSVLVMEFHRTQAAGGSTVMRNPSPAVMRILEITGLASVFSIETDGSPMPAAGV
jgi:anti-sigma B factor antagonist